MNDVQREPSGDARAFAATMRNFYLALKDEGFTEPEALVIIGQVLGAAMGGGAK